MERNSEKISYPSLSEVEAFGGDEACWGLGWGPGNKGGGSRQLIISYEVVDLE